ncbi:MAG TPA: condensation domain-containing protein, partial [Thermoanaerobaculia bacterium]|nr:condensation domain-containing protein [Thermoanaerobaculia bacterium]
MAQEVLSGFRLSPQQQHLWSLGAGREEASYRALCGVRVEGVLDTRELERALAHLIERHEILRTSFPLLPGLERPLQVIAETAPPVLERHDFTNLAPEEQESRISGLLHEMSLRPLPKEGEPALSAALLML